MQQAGYIGRIVLPVGIERDDIPAAGVVEAGSKSGRLAVIAAKENHHHSFIRRVQLFQYAAAAVLATVIDVNDFVIERQVCQRGADFLLQRPQIFYLVINWNH